MTCYIEQVMSRAAILLALALIPVLLGCAWYVIAVERAAVSRARLNAFARRQGLTITAGNGNLVIRYLATTRRWRATGLIAGLLFSFGWALRQDAVRVDSLTLFAGWFAGALVAEFRLARAPFGPRRAASLSPRVPTSYLPRTAWALLPASAAISLGVGVSTVVAVLRGQSVGPLAAVLCGTAIAVAGVVLAVQRRVLNRPQRIDEPDVLAADNAVRSRSLHVLAGGGTSVVLYCVLGQLAQLNPAGSGTLGQAVAAIAFLGIFAVPLLGYLVATSHWPASRAIGGLAGGGAH